MTATLEEQVAMGEKKAEADLQVVASEESNEEVSQTLILLPYCGDGNKGLSLQLICGRGGGLLVCLVSLAVGSSSFLSFSFMLGFFCSLFPLYCKIRILSIQILKTALICNHLQNRISVPVYGSL